LAAVLPPSGPLAGIRVVELAGWWAARTTGPRSSGAPSTRVS